MHNELSKYQSTICVCKTSQGNRNSRVGGSSSMLVQYRVVTSLQPATPGAFRGWWGLVCAGPASHWRADVISSVHRKWHASASMMLLHEHHFFLLALQVQAGSMRGWQETLQCYTPYRALEMDTILLSCARKQTGSQCRSAMAEVIWSLPTNCFNPPPPGYSILCHLKFPKAAPSI